MNNPIDVLIVDDEESIREIIEEILTMSGYTTKTAENGVKALEILKNEEVPLVLCDISMPEMDGIHLLSELKKNAISSAVVMLTAHEERDRIIKVLQLGAIDYLVKPFEGKKLLEKISVWIDLGQNLIALSKETTAGSSAAKKLRVIDLYRLKNSDLKDK